MFFYFLILIKDYRNQETIYSEIYIKKSPDFSSSIYNNALKTVIFNYSVGGHFITYDGDYGTSKRGEGYNSPAAIFGHELIHAYNDLVDNQKYNIRREKKL